MMTKKEEYEQKITQLRSKIRHFNSRYPNNAIILFMKKKILKLSGELARMERSPS